VTKVIDHIGVVVQRLEDGIAQWMDLFGYSQLTEPVINTRQKVRVVFMTKMDSCLIKLVEPVDERFKDMGLRVLSEPQPGEAFDDQQIAFVYAQQGLNIELIDTEKKAKTIGPTGKRE
jgi:methylmalonyl-CoA/ethylmalonyl-CoA epimerase